MPNRVERWQPPRLRHRHTKERAHYTSADWRARRLRILTLHAFTCSVCGRRVSGQEAHVDHIVPLEDGGSDGDANLQVLCAADHGRKTREEQRRKGFA
jgi:5-methylcytosine-specific restriction endonuclease McrA